MNEPFRSLKNHLASLPPGPIADTADVERLLAACWDDMPGDDGGMEANKLLKRMAMVAWKPPILSFAIERHGGTVLGSTRAELQHWEVNVENKMAMLVKSGHRQLLPMAKRIYVKPLVKELLHAIRTGKKDKRLMWHGEDEVILMTTDIFPKGSAVRMTLEGRRNRLREAVATELLTEGWERLSNDRFRRIPADKITP
jgi:hypothetical protein